MKFFISITFQDELLTAITIKFNNLKRYKDMRVKKMWLDGIFEENAGWRWENHHQSFHGKRNLSIDLCTASSRLIILI